MAGFDLGTFEKIKEDGAKCEFVGLDGGDDSYTLAHLPTDVEAGSTAFCMDSGATWMFHGKTNTWVKL